MRLRPLPLAVLLVIGLSLLGAAALTDFSTVPLRQWLSTYEIARAAEQAQAQHPDQARTHYRRALRWNPRDAQARLQLARMELSLHRPEHAYLELQTLTELHPEVVAAWLELAQLMQERGLMEEPEIALTHALEADAHNIEALKLRASLRHQLGQHYGAWLDLQKMVAAKPVTPDTLALKARLDAAGVRPASLPALLHSLLPASATPHSNTRRTAPDEDRFDGGLPRERWPGQLAVLRQQLQAAFQKQDVKAAQALADQASQQYPDTVYGPWLQGIVQLAQNKKAEAEKSLRDALALAPRSRLVVTGLTKIWVQTKGAAYAGEQLLKLAERDPEFGFAIHMAAVSYLKGRQPAKAETTLRRGLELQPNAAQPYRELARFYLELDRAGDALNFCDQGLQHAPQDTPLLALRARIVAQLKDTTGAIAAYEKHLAAQPDSQDSRAALARLLYASKDSTAQTRALRLLAELEVDAPASRSVQDAIGWVSLQAGQTARALDWLKLAATNAADDPAIHYHLASAYAQGKDVAQAKSEVALALGSEKPFSERLEAQRLLRDLSGVIPNR